MFLGSAAYPDVLKTYAIMSLRGGPQGRRGNPHKREISRNSVIYLKKAPNLTFAI